jgi:MoaA/NifB/PqqE/SkfB family radical SAM enzyme
MHGIEKLKYTLHAKLLRCGWLLDLAYSLAFYVLGFMDLISDRLAILNPVAPSDLKRIRPGFFLSSLRVDVTSVCNAKCTFCAYPKVVRDRTLSTAVMNMDVFRKAVMEFGRKGGRFLDLTPLVGEPLVDPGLFEKIHFAVHEAQIPHVGMNSNGILLDKNQNYKRLIDCGLAHVSISTQGTDRAIYRQVYGVDRYNILISGLHKLLAYNNQMGEPVQIRIRFRNSQKPSEIIGADDFGKCIRPYLSPRVQVSFTVRYGNWAGTITQTDISDGMKLSKERPQINVPCANLFSWSILPGGHVRMCGCILKTTDIDDLVVGNVKAASIEQLSNSPRVTEILEGFYSGSRPQVCERCTMYRPITRSWFARVKHG